MSAPKPLASGFVASAERFPERPAVQIQDSWLSYAELEAYAQRIAATLQANRTGDQRLTGVFGHRSFAAFAGVLGSLLQGDGYVPLNPTFPADRTLQMIQRAGLQRVVVEQQSLDQFVDLLASIETPLVVVVPDADELPAPTPAVARHTFISGTQLAPVSAYVAETVDPSQLAYLLFTSGSTGIPKGVMVTQANVTHFVEYMVNRYEVGADDRLSQTFDLTFDLSAFDMFVAWEAGACLCCPTQSEKMLPAKYVKNQALTIWFSVPSTAIMMKKLRMLKPDQYPTLKWSLFCGEALPLDVTEAFQEAAPASTVENLYGPTELTIACTYYRYDKGAVGEDAELGVVPIGFPYPDMECLVVDEKLEPVGEGQAGELLMTGPQLSLGYWQDDEKTGAAFVVPPGQSRTFYRTGDRVTRRKPDGPLLYLGRVDNQIKVQGYRVELGEIEAALRTAAGVDVAIAAGYPEGINGAEGIIAFIGESSVPAQDLDDALKTALPQYMRPRDIVTITTFPLNANGKVDRKALLDDYVDTDGAASVKKLN